ncbi:hypothetical protein TIFTF001_035845 [Ficus carica]|uniref:Uncharacterized protein n=1 Tax=Ficus carica TaxID=3494 RepID=A0AA88E295_FICCA|nr:hypothetical protein TIFTF001_035845 [Ficus carica]
MAGEHSSPTSLSNSWQLHELSDGRRLRDRGAGSHGAS